LFGALSFDRDRLVFVNGLRFLSRRRRMTRHFCKHRFAQQSLAEKTMQRPILSFLLVMSLAGIAHGDRVVLVAGGGDKDEDGVPATRAKLHNPFGVDFDRAGNMYIVELEGGHVHKVSKDGIFTTIAGTGEKGDSGDGGPPRRAVFNAMHNLAIAPSGDLYIADTLNHRVRKLDPRAETIGPFAGTGKKGYSSDGGAALSAEFNGVYCVTLSPDAKTLYIADLENRRVRAVEIASGKIQLVAGNGERGVPEDGAVATEAPLIDPRAVTADAGGNVYILERSGHALRVVDRGGKIRTVVGTGKPGPAGADVPALEATLRGPKHLCLDREGNVIVADTDNHVIRRYVVKEGRFVLIAGTGTKGTTGLGGPPDKLELNQPHGVYVNATGELYIVDSLNDRVLKVVK
jgi:sugar lactone lactonase YvrE